MGSTLTSQAVVDSLAGKRPAEHAIHSVSTGQAAVALAYLIFLCLWIYAEILERSKRKQYGKVQAEDEDLEVQGGTSKSTTVPLGESSTGSLSSPREAAEEYPYRSSGFVRVLACDRQAVLAHRENLRAAVEFGTILLWYYLADRTTVFPQGIKSYSRDVLGFLFLVLTLVALITSRNRVKAPLLLNRKQTEEWKGWMQVLFLLYHYYEAREVYNAIRVFIAGYVWMTGFGNFSYYYKTGNYSFSRFCQMMWRLNFLVTMTCVVLQNSYMLYYICPMHTLFTIMVYAVLGLGSKFNSTHVGIVAKILISFAVVFLFWDVKTVFYALWSPFTFIMGYSDPRKPTDDKLKEWYFRSSLDRYVWIHGMICAYCHPWAEGCLQRIDKFSKARRVAVRTAIGAVATLVLVIWYQNVYVLPKVEYNKLHPYTSWIPITVWIVLRNLTPSMRTVSLGLYGWLGCITLETYVSQFHTWLATGVPDGQPKMLLAFFPPEYPLLNFAGTTAVYVFVSYRLFILTGTLKDVVVPNKTGKEMVRNFVTLATFVAVLFLAGRLVIAITGLTDLPKSYVGAVTQHFDP